MRSPPRYRLVAMLGLGAWASIAAFSPRAGEPPPLEALRALHAPDAAAIAARSSATGAQEQLLQVAVGADGHAGRGERMMAAALAVREGGDVVDDDRWRSVRRASDREVRITAAFSEGLVRCGEGTAACLAYGRALLADPEPRLREVAVDLLARDRSPPAREALEDQLTIDGDEAVRRRIERRLR